MGFLPTVPYTAILANGDFPQAPEPLTALRKARRIVCCDGAADVLAARAPDLSAAWVVGDLDSLSAETRAKYAPRLRKVPDQETNDLAKTFAFCLSRRWLDVVFLGISGKREDHTLGNLSLLVDFARAARITALTDHGIFTPLLSSAHFVSFPGQQVSIFSFEPGLRVYAEGLKWPLDQVPFTRWWQAALNESLGDSFRLTFEGGPLLVFQTYAGKQ